MNEQLYTTDTAVERLTRSVAEVVETAGRFSRAEFSVDDVATVLEAAVQQPNRDAALKSLEKVLVATSGGRSYRYLSIGERESIVDAVLAALAVPATAEVETDPNRKRSYLAGIIHRAIPDDESLAHLCQDDDCLWYDIADAILSSMSMASEAEINERIRAARDEAWEECTRRFVELNPGIPVVSEVTP